MKTLKLLIVVLVLSTSMTSCYKNVTKTIVEPTNEDVINNMIDINNNYKNNIVVVDGVNYYLHDLK